MSTTTTTPAPDAFITSALAMAASATEQANECATKIASATVNVNKQIHDLRDDEETTDDKIREFQAAVAALDAKRESFYQTIEAYIRENLVSASTLTDEEIENLREAYRTHKSQRKSVLDLVKTLPGYSDEMVADLPELVNMSGRKSSGGSGGTRRPRLSHATVNGDEVPLNDKGNMNFTLIAQYMTKLTETKVTPSDLQSAAFAAAGTDDLSTVNDVSFVISVDGKNYTVDVITRAPESAEAPTESDSETETETE